MDVTNEVINKTQEKTGLTYREVELVQQFAKAKLEANEELPFENLEEYEVPPQILFPMLTKPAVSIKYKEFTFNMASVRLFEGIHNVVPSINRKKRRLAVLMRKEECASSVVWSRLNKKGVLTNRTNTSLEFVNSIYEMMGWDKNLRYKATGRIANSAEGLILVFDLDDAAKYDALPEEYVDPATGEVKKHVKVYYPEKYRGRVGNYYNDYVAKEQISMFESLEDYQDKKEISESATPVPAESTIGG